MGSVARAAGPTFESAAQPLSDQPSSPAAREPITLRDAYGFFLPLVMMIELNMLSKSAIHAFLARSATPAATLAGFRFGINQVRKATSDWWGIDEETQP